MSDAPRATLCERVTGYTQPPDSANMLTGRPSMIMPGSRVAILERGKYKTLIRYDSEIHPGEHTWAWVEESALDLSSAWTAPKESDLPDRSRGD